MVELNNPLMRLYQLRHNRTELSYLLRSTPSIAGLRAKLVLLDELLAERRRQCTRATPSYCAAFPRDEQKI